LIWRKAFPESRRMDLERAGNDGAIDEADRLEKRCNRRVDHRMCDPVFY
jgi:hypothetical protein